ncbi:MAG: Dihydropteridine reductase [Candidatus Magasanikbacteria bacterium GW2011_GWA2_56_11]|uniref:Dihydropteridine reductase n=1 Tax=Candidatus Magasanikbacteria bacterium GW2011_GWA2_56_11 TaxID=1619044 RepID=A0A0G1YE99_9BACT|nr:MAG: Dihydropteridine reductase [Candidatus Magasanikbacteria bacterium GW2011_GWA2_56_11]
MRPQTVLVTGGSGPLGSVIAAKLKQAGYEVIIHYYRSQKKAERLARAIGAAGTVRADLTDPLAAKKMFRAIGSVDGLVHAVGDFIYKPLKKTTAREFSAAVESNLLSAWHCLRPVLSGMRRRRYGRIVVFGTTGCGELQARPLTTPYYIGKTGLLMLVRALSREEINHGITINMVSPGVLPSGVRPSPSVPVVPFDAVARAVLFFLQDDAGHITGANLDVNHGWRPE